METKVDLNLDFSLRNKDRDFKNELDGFFFGGFVDWIRRTEDGVFVLLHDAWMPVKDWYEPGKLSGGRDLTHLARYFYNMGRAEADRTPGGGSNPSGD